MLGARRGTSSRTTGKPRNAADGPFSSKPAWDGALLVACFVAALVKGVGHSLRTASRIPTSKVAVATTRELIRSSLAKTDAAKPEGTQAGESRSFWQKILDTIGLGRKKSDGPQ